MSAWWPNIVDKDLIPAIRSLGKRGIIVKDNISVLNDSNGNPGPTCLAMTFGGGSFTLAEKKCIANVRADLLYCLAAILADGPKLFVIPDELVDDLNQIEIPLMVKDCSLPFPALIVKSGDEYHFIRSFEGRLAVVCQVGQSTAVDIMNFFQPEQMVEKNLSGQGWTWQDLGKHQIGVQVPAETWEFHRWRATLNFLLLVTTGGFVVDANKTRTNKPRHNDPSKYLIPQICKPQNIDLLRRRLVDATTSVQGTGSRKTTHWRKAHWRHVAVGPGRKGRESRLIPCCLVNKHLLTGDVADTSYEMR